MALTLFPAQHGLLTRIERYECALPSKSPNMFNGHKIVFISCGQMTDEEKTLASAIVQLVEELTPFQAYLAQRQSTLEALTENILQALQGCDGLIVVMHPRGRVSGLHGERHTRASVWIEQEIAMAAFLTQVLHKKLKVAAYVHKDIKREGMRDELQLNPVPFERNDEILVHLMEVLHRWKEGEEGLKTQRRAAS
jgi:hypothetical protein